MIFQTIKSKTIPSMGLKELPSEGEAIVLKPDGKSGVKVVGRILSSQWGDIVRDIDRAKNP